MRYYGANAVRKMNVPVYVPCKGDDHQGKAVEIVDEARPARWKLKEAAN
jgi:hypothetical protein